MRKINLKSLNPIWEADPNIVSAWAFGSAKNGLVREGGDLDIGILFYKTPLLDELADLRADIQKTLGIDEIDLLALNSLDSITKFEAISGRLLFCRNMEKRAGFVSLTAREYEYDMAYLEWGLSLVKD